MKKILTIGVLIFSNLLWAQSDTDAFKNYSRINLGLHGLELSYELPVSKKFVWENTLGIGMGSNINGSIVQYSFNFLKLSPFLKSELKYIYNVHKRKAKGKNTLNNSGNYIGFQTKYSFGNSDDTLQNQTLLTELHWGIQRSLGKRFIFNTHIGLGYLKDFESDNGKISPTLGLRFGYRLF